MAMDTEQRPDGGGNNIIQTAEEFKNKYSKKRFSSHTAPKAVLYTFLYDIYQHSESGIKGTLYPDLEEIRGRVETYEDMDLWNGYLNLTEWQRSAFNTAVFMRNSLQGSLSELNHITTSLISAEELRAELRGEQLTEAATLFLSNLTLEAYSPQRDGYSIGILRRNIEASRRYLMAYNTFVDLIAQETKTPEYVRLQVTTGKQQETINDINRALAILTETAYRERSEEPGIFPTWTPEYLRETLRAFDAIGEPPPVPADKIREARDGIRRGITKGQFSWYSLYFRYSTRYWRVNVYDE